MNSAGHSTRLSKLLKMVLRACFFGSLSAQAGSGSFSVTSGVDYSTGKYGGAAETSILYIPFTGKYESGRWTTKFTVPYLEVTSPGAVIVIDGGGDAVVIGSSQSTVRTTVKGLGDVIGALTYSLLEGETDGLFLDVTAKMKIPTGDDAKGLSTGKYDYAALLDIYRSFGNFTALATAGYRVTGNPEGFPLNNTWLGSIGGSWRFNSKTTAGVLWDVRQASYAKAAAPRDLTAYAVHKLGDNLKLQIYLYHGFSDASADWGGGAMFGIAY